MIISGTGHRPNKLFDSDYYSNANAELLKNFVKQELLKIKNVDKIVSGMALGYDFALAEASLELNIPLIAAVPFKGQEKKWSHLAQCNYQSLLSKAEKVEFICFEGYAAYKMQVRNCWMTDNSDKILALYNGDLSGGTYNCIRYAQEKGREIINIWENFIEYKKGLR